MTAIILGRRGNGLSHKNMWTASLSRPIMYNICMNFVLEFSFLMRLVSIYKKVKFVYRINGIFGEHYIWRMKVKTELAKY